MLAILTFVAGILYSNAIEYLVHKYLFHRLGRKKNSIFAFHLREHHLVSRRNNFIDRKVSKNELIGIPLILLLHSPIAFYFPWFNVAISLYGIAFIFIHNMVHRSPYIAKKYFWWHWNHHMSNQNKSWGVVLPLCLLFIVIVICNSYVRSTPHL